jgi:hypothetical protein
MKELLAKITTYNLFNYLFPGVVFVEIASKFTKYSFAQEDITTGVFIYYFIGLIISRFGSLAIAPVLKLTHFVNFGDYSDFISASKKDSKIEILSEVNNTYRTICSLFILLLFLKLYEMSEMYIPVSNEWRNILLIILLLIMFLFSYRKQTNFIVKRVQVNQKETT